MVKRVAIAERPHWRAQAEEYGFKFHTMYGEPYWCEDYFYQFTLAQIEALEAVTEELHQMALEAVKYVVASDDLMRKFALPEAMWPYIRESWEKQQFTLYGRFDFAYDGINPPKMLEYNADTPTSLYESAFFQWLWLEDQIEAGALPDSADQFNSIQEALIERFRHFKAEEGDFLHFSCCDDSDEDRGTTEYLQDCADEAGLPNTFLFIEEIGIDGEGTFTDLDDLAIDSIFKLYPWEFMLREPFAESLSSSDTLWLEPAWKAILSNKALLPLMWALYPDHPNLLPAYFEGERGSETLKDYVHKPIFSREGANITIIKEGEILERAEGPYGEEGAIIQAYHPLPQFGDNHTLIGSWIVGDRACGICVREDKSRITQDLSRFYPHAIIG